MDGRADGVPRLDRVTQEEFDELFLGPQRPVILTKQATGWPAHSRWDLDYLESLAGNRRVIVGLLDDEGETGYTSTEQRSTTFADFIGGVRRAGNTLHKEYLALSSVVLGPKTFRFKEPHLPELAGDIADLGLMDPTRLEETNLWFGAGGNASKLHFDVPDNLMTLIRGRKHFRLFPPSQTKFLYPYEFHEENFFYGYVNPRSPDLERFPLFREARGIECTLEAGETLYLPSLWWHYVLSEDVNVAINGWWEGRPGTKNRNPANRYDRGRLMELVRRVSNACFLPIDGDRERRAWAVADALCERLMDAGLADEDYLRIWTSLDHPVTSVLLAAACIGAAMPPHRLEALVGIAVAALGDSSAAPAPGAPSAGSLSPAELYGAIDHLGEVPSPVEALGQLVSVPRLRQALLSFDPTEALPPYFDAIEAALEA